jgi:hypothetical protein
MPLPPVFDAHGDVLPLSEDELYAHWAKTFLRDRAGGWSPDSAPGQNAIKEFEAFVRETQARAVESFVRGWHTREGITGGPPWWVETKAEEYAEAVRAGHLDLSGNRLVQ